MVNDIRIPPSMVGLAALLIPFYVQAPRGLSAEEKRVKLIELFHESVRDFSRDAQFHIPLNEIHPTFWLISDQIRRETSSRFVLVSFKCFRRVRSALVPMSVF